MPELPQTRLRQPGKAATSAQPVDPRPALRAMTGADLLAVVAVEAGSYSFPWTRGNFIDALAAGYTAQVLEDGVQGLVGYTVVMPGVDELHLLNITVAPAWQGRGHGNRLLDAVLLQARARAAPLVWLEVRAGNVRAQALYRRRGFTLVGTRSGYYPGPRATREDAVVMRLRVPGVPLHALD